jgi:hypothetical protein
MQGFIENKHAHTDGKNDMIIIIGAIF